MSPARAPRWSRTPVTVSSRWALVAPSSTVALPRYESAGDLATGAGLSLPAEPYEPGPAENDLPLSYQSSAVSAKASMVDSRAYQPLSSGSLPMRRCVGELSDRLTFGIELER